MPDLLTISALITTIKNATDLAKGLKNIDTTLEKAELKLKMAELIEALADAKIQVVEIQELVQEKDKKIQELEKSLENKSKLIRHKGMYYEIDVNSKPIGDPYCSHCWESNNKTIHLDNIGGLYRCSSCESIITN